MTKGQRCASCARGGADCIAVAQDDWLEKAGAIIQARIELYAQSEIRFNLMSVIRDRRAVYEEQLASLQARRASTGNTGADGRRHSTTPPTNNIP